MMHSDSWKDGARILCIRPDNLGDVLMTTPAFRALKETWPSCELTLLASSAGADIAQYIPEIEQIITFDIPWVSGAAGAQGGITSLLEQLKAQAFDAAIIFTVQSQSSLPSAMLCYQAGIPRVLGYCRENPYHLLTDWVPDPEILVATQHEVERQLALVATIGCYTTQQNLSLTVSLADRMHAQHVLAEQGMEMNRPWLVIHPGASEARRCYPADCYIQAVRLLRHQDDYQIVLTGSSAERELTTSIEDAIRDDSENNAVVNLAGQLTIGQLIGLLAEAPVLVANNTGPVHIAAAVGTPVVVLYAKTNPQHTPWQVPNRVLYFDVPPSLRSKNRLLQHFPDTILSTASPGAIVRAVDEVVGEENIVR